MEKDLTSSHIDQADQKILDVVSKNGRIAVTDLAREVGMSKTPCGVRLKKLIDTRFILGFRAVLNSQKLDLTHVSFLEITLRDTTQPALKAFNEAVQAVPEVEECYMIAGTFDYLLKVRTKDIHNYRRVLADHISSLPHLSKSSTYASLEAIKESGF